MSTQNTKKTYQPHAMIKGSKVIYPKTPKDHERLADAGYVHEDKGHWMFKGDSEPVFVTTEEMHNKLHKMGWTNSIVLETPNGRDFYLVKDKKTFDEQQRRGYSARSSGSSSNDECSEVSSDGNGSSDCENVEVSSENVV